MSANPGTAAPTGRKKPAQGKERSDAALGHASQNTSSPEGEKEGGELPRGWSEQRIEQLFAPLEDGRTLHQGWSPQCDKVPSPSEDVWGVLKTTAIQAGEFQPEHNKLLPPGLEPRPMIEVKEGDILLTCAGPRVRCGVSCLVRQTRKRLLMSGKMYRFRVDVDRTDARYVEAFLQTERARQAIDKMKTGSSDSGLNLTHERFRQLLVPVAPLPEQRRIVAEIEKQFTRLEAGVAALRRVQANLKRYRAAVLKAACEGRLVPTEAELRRTMDGTDGTDKSGLKSVSSVKSVVKNPRDETGEALLARILAERRQNWQGRGQYNEPAAPDTSKLPVIPDGWTWATLDSIIREPLRNGHSAKATGSDRGLRVFTLSAVTEGDFSERNTKLSVATEEKVAGLWAEPGDIYVERSNTPELVGIARLYKGPSRFAFIPDLFIRVRVASPVSKRYIEMCLLSERGRTFFRSRAQGISGTMPKIDQETVELAPIPLPPLAEQTRIVAEVERRLSVVEELESVVTANLQRASRLRQSILQKAFTGELV